MDAIKYYTNKSWAEVQEELPSGAIISKRDNCLGYYEIILNSSSCIYPRYRDRITVETDDLKTLIA